MDMEACDLLHVLWLGAARTRLDRFFWRSLHSILASKLLSVTIRLCHKVATLVQDFCSQYGLDRSIVEELSFSKA